MTTPPPTRWRVLRLEGPEGARFIAAAYEGAFDLDVAAHMAQRLAPKYPDALVVIGPVRP